MKATRPSNWFWGSASSRSCRPTPTAATPGPTTATSIAGRNEVERLFRRLKGFRRIFSRFEKLDLMFTAFIHFASIVDMICVNTP
jgi:transposase